MKKKLIYILASFVFSFLLFSFSQAQENYFIYLTWKAGTLSEPDFEGKNLPVTESKVYLSAQIFDLAGRKVDPNQFIFRWEVNFNDHFFDCLEDDFFKALPGKNKICFLASKADFLPYQVKVIIQRGNWWQEKTIVIPYQVPEIVIVPQGRKVSLKKIALKPTMNFVLKKYYFPDFKNLEIRWYLDEEKSEGEVENPSFLALEFYPGIEKGRKFHLYAECFDKRFRFLEAKAGPIEIIKK